MKIRSFPIQRNGDGGSLPLANYPAEVNEKTLYICPSEIRRPRAPHHDLESLLVLAYRLMMAFYDGIVNSRQRRLLNPPECPCRVGEAGLQ